MLTIAVMYSENSTMPYHNLLSENLMTKDDLTNYDLKTHQNLSSENILEHKLYLVSNQNPVFTVLNHTTGEYFMEFKKKEQDVMWWSLVGLNTIWYAYALMQYQNFHTLFLLGTTKTVDIICLYFCYYTKLLDYSYWINPIFHNSAYTEETAKKYLLSNKKYYDNIIFYTRLKWACLFMASITTKLIITTHINNLELIVKNTTTKVLRG